MKCKDCKKMWRGYDSREWCEECKDCQKLSDYCKKMLQKCYPVYVKVENECFIFRCLEYKRRTETLPELYLMSWSTLFLKRFCCY